ncbi:hypothetical protein M6B38_244255 [Iris pallida]|uniref:Uncharacterized protein n=1 Tax=Iris pallida TaxID=29817 RepID=A0AAX6DHS5_IRIPA|nr:hypothetical protein M6B38_244250 [Iris pallida]KAJ6791324.1 hypothetical protein M6B38_244255 [Iris pallida]
MPDMKRRMRCIFFEITSDEVVDSIIRSSFWCYFGFWSNRIIHHIRLRSRSREYRHPSLQEISNSAG